MCLILFGCFSIDCLVPFQRFFGSLTECFTALKDELLKPLPRSLHVHSLGFAFLLIFYFGAFLKPLLGNIFYFLLGS